MIEMTPSDPANPLLHRKFTARATKQASSLFENRRSSISVMDKHARRWRMSTAVVPKQHWVRGPAECCSRTVRYQGSDSIISYSGSYAVDGDRFTVTLMTRRHAAGQESLVGDDEVQLTFEGISKGHFGRGSGSVHGSGMKVDVTLIPVRPEEVKAPIAYTAEDFHPERLPQAQDALNHSSFHIKVTALLSFDFRHSTWKMWSRALSATYRFLFCDTPASTKRGPPISHALVRLPRHLRRLS